MLISCLWEITMKELLTKLREAYSEPAEFIKEELCEFQSTTNPAFKGRIGMLGKVSLSMCCVHFISNLSSSMRTSYVIRIHYNSATRELYVHTRNSVYKFLTSISFEQKDYSWTLPENLRLQYEAFLGQDAIVASALA